jgi:hypothetical protein
MTTSLDRVYPFNSTVHDEKFSRLLTVLFVEGIALTSHIAEARVDASRLVRLRVLFTSNCWQAQYKAKADWEAGIRARSGAPKARGCA